MSTQTSERIEVGTCDLGNVFIYPMSNESGNTWIVRAGNHTVGTYDNLTAAEAVGRALVGDVNLKTEYVAEKEPEYAEPARKAVTKK